MVWVRGGRVGGRGDEGWMGGGRFDGFEVRFDEPIVDRREVEE